MTVGIKHKDLSNGSGYLTTLQDESYFLNLISQALSSGVTVEFGGEFNSNITVFDLINFVLDLYTYETDLKMISDVASSGGGDPFQPGKDGEHGTLEDFVKRYEGKTYDEIIKEGGDARYGYKNGPILNYVEDPLNSGKYIDMTHMLIVGRKGALHGFANEVSQFFAGHPSAFKRQDLWSNRLGYAFWTTYEWNVMSDPENLVYYLHHFLINR